MAFERCSGPCWQPGVCTLARRHRAELGGLLVVPGQALLPMLRDRAEAIPARPGLPLRVGETTVIPTSLPSLAAPRPYSCVRPPSRRR